MSENTNTMDSSVHDALSAAHATLAAAPAEPQKPRAKRTLPEIIETAVDRGMRVSLTRAGYEIDGFYRQGAMRVEDDEKGGLSAIDRKEKKTVLRTFDDLVKLNFQHWKLSREKSPEFLNPPREWLEEFQRLNLVQRVVVFQPV
jgi:hypothetical protein